MISKIFRNIEKIPITILLMVTIIACFGFILMYSAAQGNFYPWAMRQMLYFAVFFPLMIIIGLINIRFWYKASYLLYYVTLLLLIVVFLFGHTAMGATRWINLGLIKLQPSELMKIAIIFALARYFHDLNQKKIMIKHLIMPSIIIITPALLIIKQPDLGTGLILLMLGAIIFFIAGVNKWFFILGLLLILSVIPLLWQFLYDYQKNRIINFMNPENDPLGSGYNVIQSKIAIGSGGMVGKGFLKGTQSQLQFLPEHQTDFIFTMLSEEWGFVGGLSILVIYSILIFYCYLIAINARSIFGKIISLGVISMIFLHIFINIAMVMGILPVVGVPLPLLSYGGTMMMTVLIGLGLVINVHIYSKTTINNSLKSLF